MLQVTVFIYSYLYTKGSKKPHLGVCKWVKISTKFCSKLQNPYVIGAVFLYSCTTPRCSEVTGFYMMLEDPVNNVHNSAIYASILVVKRAFNVHVYKQKLKLQ